MEVSCCGAVIGCIGPLVAIRQGNGRGAVVVEGQVVLLSRDEGLASTIGRLLSDGEGVAQFHSAAELTDWSTPTVATVILDSQPHVRRLSYKHVRERYHGPLIMLLDMDERRPDLPPDGARRYLQRPFEVAELSSLLDTPVPELGPFEAAIIAAWSHRVTVEPPVPVRPRPATQLPSWGPSPWRRARVWAVTIVALVGLLLVVSLSGQGSCASPCTQVGGPVAGAAEAGTPPTSKPATGSVRGSGDSQPPGSSAVSSQPPTPTGATDFPVVTGVGGLIESTSPITGSDTTPTSGPVAVPGVPGPPGVGPPSTTNPPSGTTPPPTTGPPATGTPTTVPADHRAAHHGAAAQDRAADHRAPNHGPTHHGPTHHGAADHRPAHHGPTHDRATHHGAADHRAADHRAPYHGPGDHGAADHRAAHNRGGDGGPHDLTGPGSPMTRSAIPRRPAPSRHRLNAVPPGRLGHGPGRP
jgi:hypothetical protein